MSKNKVFLLDRLIAMPLAVYFWWHERRQKSDKRHKSINTSGGDSVKK